MGNLYLAVETTVRELDAKLLLAAEAALQGYKVFIMPQELVLQFASRMKTGIIIFKDSQPHAAKTFNKMQKHGMYVYVHDEEGFVFLNDETYMNSRLRFETIKYIDKFLTWGDKQSSIVERALKEVNSTCTVCATGHTRLDILKPQFSQKLYGKKEKQNVVLVNTKLSEANHRSGPNGWMDILEAHNVLHSDAERARRYKQKEFKEKLLKEYFDLIRELNQKLPEYHIIIRPHPSENKNTWLDFAQNMTNVEVRWDKSIGYWLNQCDVIIHTGCTTAIEGALMGKPSITYHPIESPEFNAPLPDTVSYKATKKIDVIHMIKTKRFDSHKLAGLKDHLKSYDTGDAHKNIIQELPVLSAHKPEKLINTLLSIGAYNLYKTYYGLKNSRLGVKQKQIDPKFNTSITNIKTILKALKPDDYSKLNVKTIAQDLYVVSTKNPKSE